MHVGRKYDGWEIKSHVKVFETDRQTFSKKPNPISGKYFMTF